MISRSELYPKAWALKKRLRRERARQHDHGGVLIGSEVVATHQSEAYAYLHSFDVG